jgi:hypothetical protein
MHWRAGSLAPGNFGKDRESNCAAMEFGRSGGIPRGFGSGNSRHKNIYTQIRLAFSYNLKM